MASLDYGETHLGIQGIQRLLPKMLSSTQGYASPKLSDRIPLPRLEL
ncbi:MAG TPA: hypothetical protein V6C85_11190 [Allocoleopsis sp.]